MDPLTIGLVLVLLGFIVYKYLWFQTKYFEHYGVDYIQPIPLLGNMAPVVFRRFYLGDYLWNVYNRFPNLKYFGFFNFTSPVIAIRDPELVASIGLKHFDHFTDHRGLIDEDLDPLMGKNLFGLRGDAWRDMRKILSPAFTSAKMKVMSELIIDCADRFTEFIAAQSTKEREYDLWDIFRRYTNDVVATSSYGIAIDSLRDPENEFYRYGREAINLTTGTTPLKLLMASSFPILSRLFGIRIFSEKIRIYFKSVVKETVKMRDEKGIHRPDMIQLMMDSKDKDGNRMSLDDMTNQAFIFFLGGFDTSAGLMSFAAHEIAVHPEIQAKLLAEIEGVLQKTNGKLTYDALKDMPYMDAILDETNRMYPAAPFLDRVCVKEFELPPAGPGLKPVIVSPGDCLWFLPVGFHRDPNYFPEPSKFKPERFLNNEVSSAHYMPFGLGPRACIGNRFALMQVKIMLFYLLQRCKLEPSSNTTIPMKFRTGSVQPYPKTGFRLNFKTRDGYACPNTDKARYGASTSTM